MNITKEEYKDCLISMVVDEGIPFVHVESPAFLKVHGPMIKHYSIQLSRRTLREMVVWRSTKVRFFLKLICSL